MTIFASNALRFRRGWICCDDFGKVDTALRVC